MPQIDKDKIIRRQMDAVDDMGVEQLRDKFAELFGLEPHSFSADYLRRRIGYRLQELQFGGLSTESAKLLDSLADADPLANLQSVPARRYSRARGTRYLREWRGKTYEVTVLGPKEFEYDRQVYNSLTAIATKITGTHQSGHKFFGVTK